jgi:tripartite-type tricarboxylate transporter receptor subunit TctC
MKTNGRLLSALIAFIAGWSAVRTPALLAQDKYPTRPIRILIPFPAAGAVDTIGRSIGDQLAAQLGKPVVVDNRPGAAGRLATEMLAKAEPDGYPSRQAKEQGSQLQDVGEYPDDCSHQCQHAFIMPDSTRACCRATPPNP